MAPRLLDPNASLALVPKRCGKEVKIEKQNPSSEQMTRDR
jgi:hypothetical protein